MKDLTVFVLTHNRGKLLLETVQSILNQTCHDFKFIVSDTSSNDETVKLLAENKLLGKLEYRKRDKEYTSFEHFNLCLSDVKTKYFILFHDDDVMLPDMVQALYNTIKASDYVAVGCNAYVLRENQKTKKRMFRNTKNKIFENTNTFTDMYLKGSIVPFPSYIYNKEKIEKLEFIYDAGKYSDVTWLLRILEVGKIYWLSESYMYYRVHPNQDSGKFSYGMQYLLINKFRLYCKSKDSLLLLKKYRLYQIYVCAIQKNKYSIALLRFFMKNSFFHCFPKMIVRLTLYKLFF